MNKDEIVQQVLDDKWWPFDRVDPKILQEAMRKDKKEQLEKVEEALL
jgi:hypothetical protein